MQLAVMIIRLINRPVACEMIICSKTVLINSSRMAVAIWGLSYAKCCKNLLRLRFALQLMGSHGELMGTAASLVPSEMGAKTGKCFFGEIYFQSKHLFVALNISQNGHEICRKNIDPLSTIWLTLRLTPLTNLACSIS